MKATCDALQDSDDGAAPRLGERASLYSCLLRSRWMQTARVAAVTLGLS